MKYFVLFTVGVLGVILLFLAVRRDAQSDRTKRTAVEQKQRIAELERQCRTGRVVTAVPRTPRDTIRLSRPSVVPTSSSNPGPMPDNLRWWERKVITPVAITLTKRDNLERFHALLGRQVAMMKECPKLGNHICIPRITVMRMSINRYLKRMMQADGKKLEVAGGEGYLHYVASLTLYSNNLENLYAFVGKQQFKLRGCSVPSWRTPNDDPDCAERLSKSAVEIDAYFKKIVNDHGGPLIDRNWNKH